MITSENKNNLLASCRRCTLFVQQVHKPAVFDRIEAHPCLGREQAPCLREQGFTPPIIWPMLAGLGSASTVSFSCGLLTRRSRKEWRSSVGPRANRREEAADSWHRFCQSSTVPVGSKRSSSQPRVPPRLKNRFRSKSGSPSRKEPPKLHSFFATPPLPLPAAACPPQDLGSREVGSKQQHNQQPASQPHTQPDTLLPGSSPGKELEVSQAGCSQSPALRSPPPSLPTGSRKGSRRDEGTSPIAKFFAQWPGIGNGSGVTTPKNGDGDGCGDPTTTNGGAGDRTNPPSKSTGTARQPRPRKSKGARQ